MKRPQGHGRLSGGKVQRISIVRAILKNVPIVIIDEALTYTDAENENRIQPVIKNPVRDKTFVVIARRLQTIAEAGQILVMQDGKIVECDKHQTVYEHRHGIESPAELTVRCVKRHKIGTFVN